MRTRLRVAAVLAAVGSVSPLPALAASWTFETVALSGQPVPGLPGVTWSGLGGAPALDNAGRTAFSGGLAGTGVEGSNNAAAAAGSPGSLGLVARKGDVAPGTGDAVFDFAFSVAALTDAGDTVFASRLDGSGVTSANDQGVFTESGGVIGLLLREGDIAPGTGGATYTSFALSVNRSGDFAFRSVLAGSEVTSANSDSLFEGSAGSVALLARSGDAAPGTAGGTFSVFGTPSVNGAGETVFASLLNGTGITPENNSAVFKEEGGSLGLVVRAGEAAPGTGGARFAGFGDVALDDGGDAAFSASLAGTDVGASNNAALFREEGGGLGLVAREGDEAPGTGGADFSSFVGPILNGEGDIAFVGRLAGTGVTVENGQGIFAEYGGSLGLVVRQGDQIEVLPGDLRTIAFLTLGRFGLNDAGQVGFQANFTDGSSGIFLASLGDARVPLPPSALLLLGGLGLLGWRARGRSPGPPA